MATFLVSLFSIATNEELSFECDADNSMHAENMAQTFYPDAIVQGWKFADADAQAQYEATRAEHAPKVFTHATGRHYDRAQVLEISAEIGDYDDLDMAECVATFDDKSRYIKGRVKFFVFRGDSEQAIGRAVLAQYDSGAYELI